MTTQVAEENGFQKCGRVLLTRIRASAAPFIAYAQKHKSQARAGLLAATGVASYLFPYVAGPVVAGLCVYRTLIPAYEHKGDDKDYREEGKKRSLGLSLGIVLTGWYFVSYPLYIQNSTVPVTQESKAIITKAGQEMLGGYLIGGKVPASVTKFNDKTGLYFKLGDENWSDWRINIIENPDGSRKACGSLEIIAPPTPKALSKGYDSGNHKVFVDTICSKN